MSSNSNQPTRSGNKIWGSKTQEYLRRKSRQSLEKNSDTALLFFQLDLENSKKNFYGETLAKVWVNNKGVLVNGTIDLKEGNESSQSDIPNKLLTLTFGVYNEHLKELGIEPRLGDYFASKNRFFLIHNKTIPDSNSVSVLTDRESLYTRYELIQVDDEQLEGIDTEVLGTMNDINLQQGYNI